ncbi:MAG: GNAT family N-acetyltransferase [Asticcacaulis sp.]
MPTLTPPLVPMLETGPLRLRGHRLSDLEACLALWSHPEVTRFIGGRPVTAEEIWLRMMRYAGHWALLGHGYWAITLAESDTVIGEIGLTDFLREVSPSLVGKLELGWVLDPHYQGRGLASRAVRAVLDYATLTWPDMHRVCMIDPANEASIRLAERCGFTPYAETTYKDAPVILFEHK